MPLGTKVKISPNREERQLQSLNKSYFTKPEKSIFVKCTNNEGFFHFRKVSDFVRCGVHFALSRLVHQFHFVVQHGDEVVLLGHGLRNALSHVLEVQGNLRLKP